MNPRDEFFELLQGALSLLEMRAAFDGDPVLLLLTGDEKDPEVTVFTSIGRVRTKPPRTALPAAPAPRRSPDRGPDEPTKS